MDGRWGWVNGVVDLLGAKKDKSPTRVSMQGFIIWLLDLGSNQGPTD